MNKTQERNKYYQKAPEDQEIKAMRENFAVELRKQKRNYLIKKKRAIFCNSSNDNPLGLHSHLEQIIGELRTVVDVERTEILLHRFKLLSSQVADFSFYAWLDLVLLKQFLFMVSSDVLSIQNTALWILINEFHHSGRSIEAFVNHGVLDVLTKVLQNVECPDIVDHCLWLLGNIVSESIIFRDLVLADAILQEILNHSSSLDQEVQRSSYWVLFSISCQKPAPSLASAFSIFRTIQFGLESEDSQTIEHCAWITFYLLDAHSLILDKVLTSQVIVLIFQLLDKTESELLKPLLKIIGNIASGTDNQTNTLISFGILPKISKLTSSPILQVRKEVFFILSNILACTEDTALKVVQSDLITQILENTSNPEHQIKKYAILGLCNSTYQKSRKIFNCLKKVNVLWHLVNLLQSQEEQILFESLKALHNILNRSKDFQGIENHSLFLLKFYELSGFDILDLLKVHRNERISRESLKILQDFSEDFLNLN